MRVDMRKVEEKMIIKIIDNNMKIPKIENHTKGQWATRLINNIIWGKSQFNPNNEKDEEIKLEAQRLVQNDKAND